MPKHSNLFYICKISKTADYDENKKSYFKPIKNAVAFGNNYGLDLFTHNGFIYEGITGSRLRGAPELMTLDEYISDKGGIEMLKNKLLNLIPIYGLSPRYTCPYVNKEDIFPMEGVDESADGSTKTAVHLNDCKRFRPVKPPREL